MARFSRTSLFLIVSGTVFLLDQVTKALVRVLLPPGGEVKVIPGFFSLVHVWNPGVAFGLLASHPFWAKYLLMGINVLAIIFLYRFARRSGQVVFPALVAGGALGNLLDRLLYGRVFDFLDFYLGPYHWPAFNLADAAISCGVIGLLASFLLSPSQEGSTLK